MSNTTVRDIKPLGFQWEALDPFLFCVHHNDSYPVGNEQMGPDASLAGRRLGQDFEGKDGWRMYHGESVPGFPYHPHRGFETVTLVRHGLIDHSDSLGAAARFGNGDVQWLTAGKGILHAEMFPLLDRENPNPLELFQIWLNLPAASKFAQPHFQMFWSDDIPTHVAHDDDGRQTTVTLVAGPLGDVVPPSPPPESWASRPESDLAIWTIRMEPRATWTLPAARTGTNRALYFFRGSSMRIDGTPIPAYSRAVLAPDVDATLENGEDEAELLLLQGRPIGEPIAQYGPFVMNTQEEIYQAFDDYKRTQFGGWPWPSESPVHPREESRFAKHADGRVEHPV